MKLTCLFVFLISSALLFGQKHGLYKEIDKIIRYETDLPYPIQKSFIIGVIKGDSTWVLNFGPDHIDTLDKFEIGGITKVFTASLATKLHQENFLHLDSSINSFLPQVYRNPSLSEYTLSDLLTHQINFPKRPSNLATREFNISNPYAFYTKEDLLEYYANFSQGQNRSWPSLKLHYSHINYGLLEVIMEAVMDMPLEDLYQFYLFQDWKLFNTSLNVLPNNLKVGYDRSNMIPEPWTYQSFAGSEGLVSNMLDLLKFTSISISSKDPLIESSQEITEKTKIYNKLAMSNAWYILKSRKTGNIYTHSGSTERHKAYIHFKHESKTGVVILCQSSEGVGELGLLIMRLINNNWKKKNG
jgi:CubicO group peptidase (beta-lactamase class C family)